MPNDVLTRAIDALASGRDLAREQAGAVLGEIMRGDAADPQIAGFLIALRTKGETVDELDGFASTALDFARPVRSDEPLLDTCIHIRTVVMNDGAAHVQAGGGTVADAQPAYEFAESEAKARAVLRAVELALEQPDWP